MSNKEDLLNIGNGDNKNNLKKILIYVAVAFLVFVIGVISFAVIQNNKNSQKEAIIPPETKAKPKEENIFKQIPIENENVQQSQSQQPKMNIKQDEEQPQPKAVSSVNETKPQVQPETIKEPVEKKTLKASKPEIKNSVKSSKQSLSGAKYYIQVAALLRYKKPSKRFLELITKNGYKYKFFVTYVKLKGEKVKITKILVGPFANRKEAKKALKKVKANITQNAFIFKVK